MFSRHSRHTPSHRAVNHRWFQRRIAEHLFSLPGNPADRVLFDFHLKRCRPCRSMFRLFNRPDTRRELSSGHPSPFVIYSFALSSHFAASRDRADVANHVAACSACRADIALVKQYAQQPTPGTIPLAPRSRRATPMASTFPAMIAALCLIALGYLIAVLVPLRHTPPSVPRLVLSSLRGETETMLTIRSVDKVVSVSLPPSVDRMPAHACTLAVLDAAGRQSGLISLAPSELRSGRALLVPARLFPTGSCDVLVGCAVEPEHNIQSHVFTTRSQ